MVMQRRPLRAALYCDKCLCTTNHDYIGRTAMPFFDKTEGYEYKCGRTGCDRTKVSLRKLHVELPEAQP